MEFLVVWGNVVLVSLLALLVLYAVASVVLFVGSYVGYRILFFLAITAAVSLVIHDVGREGTE